MDPWVQSTIVREVLAHGVSGEVLLPESRCHLADAITGMLADPLQVSGNHLDRRREEPILCVPPEF